MILEVEGEAPIEVTDPAAVRGAIRKLKSTGPSFLALNASPDDFLQIAAGDLGWMAEYRKNANRSHHRAYLEEPSLLVRDGARLGFTAGAIEMRSDEWLDGKEVTELVLAYLAGTGWPEFVRWRDYSHLYFE